MIGRVEIPDPKTPGSGDILDKGGDLASWFSHQPKAFWTLVVIAVLALIVTSLLKRPFVRGLVIGAILLVIVATIAL